MDLKINKKIMFLFTIFIMVFLAIVVKLAWIIVVDGEELRQEVKYQKLNENKILFERGLIYDRNGELLATNKYKYKIGLRRNGLTNNEIDKCIEQISDILPEFSKEELTEIFINESKEDFYFTYVFDKEIALELYIVQNIWIDKQVYRVYPNGSLAAQVVGYSNTYEDVNKYSRLVGRYGIESKFNEEMSGIDGLKKTEEDRWKHELVDSDSTLINAKDGNNINLTIDSVVQYYLESALKTAYEEEEALGAHGLVINVKTGEILGMASYPTFDPNDNTLIGYTDEEIDEMTPEEYNDAFFGALKNRLVSDSYELGSIIKLVTTSLALEGGYYTPDSYFDEGNYIEVQGGGVRCWKFPEKHPPGTLTQAVADSCNPVFVKIGQTMGDKAIYDGFEKFGLFEYTGVELPAEALGIKQEYEVTTPMTVANMTFGHGATYTQLQGAMAIAAVVNGGDLLKPQIVKSITNENGVLVYENSPVIVRKVISEITSQQMREIMEHVVESGSGSAVKTTGLRVGAKTGTSQKLIKGEYVNDHILGSFLAVLPMEDPEIMIYIILDDPVTLSGSGSAGPVVKGILDDLADYYDFARSVESQAVYTSVPNIVGLTLEEGEEILTDAGFTFSVNESEVDTSKFIIINQYPKAGTLRVVGEKIIMEVVQ